MTTPKSDLKSPCHMWCDQAKSVWSRSNLVFIFLTNCMHHFYSYILQKTPLKLVDWFQRYEQLKDAKNNKKQKTFSALLSSISKSIFPISDIFCLITSHISPGKVPDLERIQIWHVCSRSGTINPTMHCTYTFRFTFQTSF